jgi:hypothetical protein
MPTAKKVRCSCARCGKVKYLPAAGTDRSEKFLCEPCDDKFIAWCEQTIARCYGCVNFNLIETWLAGKVVR